MIHSGELKGVSQGLSRSCPCAELGIPIQVNTTVTRYNIGDFDNIAKLISGFNPILWSVFFLVPTGRGRVEDEASAEEFEEVFARMYELSKVMPYDIKSTEAPHYRRYVAQARVRESRAGKRTPEPSERRGSRTR